MVLMGGSASASPGESDNSRERRRVSIEALRKLAIDAKSAERMAKAGAVPVALDAMLKSGDEAVAEEGEADSDIHYKQAMQVAKEVNKKEARHSQPCKIQWSDKSLQL